MSASTAWVGGVAILLLFAFSGASSNSIPTSFYPTGLDRHHSWRGVPDLTFEQADAPKQEDEASYPFLIDLPTPLKRSKELVDIAVPAVVSKRSVRRYCGEQLVSTLQLACQKHGKRRRKRTAGATNHPMLASEWTSGEMTEKEVEEAIYKGMMQAYHGMLTSKPPGELPRHVDKRGVTDSCCRRACSWSTLVSFC